MTTPNHPNPLDDKLLELLRGELPPAEAEALRARVAADPALGAARDRWARLLAVTSAAFPLTLPPGTADRVAAQVVARVRDEEARAARTSAPGRTVAAARGFWWKVLAVSAAAHAAVLGALAVRGAMTPTPPPVEPFWVSTRLDVPADDAPEAPAPDRYVLPEAPGLDVGPVEVPEPREPAGGSGHPAGPAMGPTVVLRTTAAAFRVRTDDGAKRAIEERLRVRGSLETIARSLGALARLQEADGGFPAPTPVPSPDAEARRDATAWAVLPFLGDGQSSAAGAHRTVVAAAMAFLARPTSSAPSDVVLWALCEDHALAAPYRTPAENRERADALRALWARRESSVAGTAPDRTAPDSVATLARTAAARLRLTAAPTTVLASATVTDWLAADVTLDDAAARGTALARSGDAAAFARWTPRAAATLRSLVGDDGLVRGDAAASPGVRVVHTAKALLGLQVPFRD